MRYFLLVKGPYHEQANIFFGCVTKVKDRFGAQLDLPHFENQKKKDVSVHRCHIQLKPSIWISVLFAVMLCFDFVYIYIYFRVYMYICLCLVFAYLYVGIRFEG